MSQYLDGARESLRKQEERLEADDRHFKAEGWRSGVSDYNQRRSEITEQWLKLAAIERGLNPWAQEAPEAGASR